MLDTATVNDTSSGTPSFVSAPKVAKWASRSTLLSTFTAMTSGLGAGLQPPQETVFLSRTEQRIMHRALRRSLRIIA